jgi:hypothetical protein
MARIYVDLRKQYLGPQPLKSNWPDLDAPPPEHCKAWRYKVLSKGCRTIWEGKDLDAAYAYMRLMASPTNRLSVKKYEPSEGVLHQQRQQEKSDWRWQAGFGA